MFHHRPVTGRLLSVILLASAACGCSDSQEWIAKRGTGIGIQTASARPERPTRAPKPMMDEADFKPLNPTRQNPFVYGGQLTSLSPEATPTRLSKIVVLGFVSTDEPAVILSLHGEPYTLSAGQSVGVIQVERIAPPTVTLRSGHSTWTASMFD